MQKIFFAILLLMLLFAGCGKNETAKKPVRELLPERTQTTYFYNYMFEGRQSPSEIYALSDEEIVILEKMAANGEGKAGVRLYLYYAHTVSNLELAEEAIEMAPLGNGIGEYHIATFRLHRPGRCYLQKKQVVELVAMAASGNREAAKRLSEYYWEDFLNEELGMVFGSFANGNNSAMPRMQQVDAEFKKGNFELVRKRTPSTIIKLWDELF